MNNEKHLYDLSQIRSIVNSAIALAKNNQLVDINALLPDNAYKIAGKGEYWDRGSVKQSIKTAMLHASSFLLSKNGINNYLDELQLSAPSVVLDGEPRFYELNGETFNKVVMNEIMDRYKLIKEHQFTPLYLHSPIAQKTASDIITWVEQNSFNIEGQSGNKHIVVDIENVREYLKGIEVIPIKPIEWPTESDINNIITHFMPAIKNYGERVWFEKGIKQSIEFMKSKLSSLPSEGKEKECNCSHDEVCGICHKEKGYKVENGKLIKVFGVPKKEKEQNWTPELKATCKAFVAEHVKKEKSKYKSH